MLLISTGVVVSILTLVTVLARRERQGESPGDPDRPSYRMPRIYPTLFRIFAVIFLLGAALPFAVMFVFWW